MKNNCFSLLHPFRWRILTVSILTLLQSLLQVALAFLTRFVIDAALEGSGKLTLWGVLLLGDILAIVLTHMLVNWYSGSTADKMIARLRQGVLRGILYTRDATVLDHHSGQLLSRGMEDVHAVCEGAVVALPSLVGQITCLVAAFVAVLMLSLPVAGVLLVAAVVVGVLVAFLRPVMKERHRTVRETDEKVMAAMQEDLQQLELIQSLDAQEPVLKRFGRRLRKNLNARFHRRKWSVGSNGVFSAVVQISTGLLLLWGVSQVAAGGMTYGSLTAMLQLLALFRGPVLGLSGLWTRITVVEVSLERLSHMLTVDTPVPRLAEIPDVQEIVFEKVTFSYPDDEAPVLENFDFSFPVSGWTCLTGISGKGKTTIFKLMLGLYTPQAGRIYLKTKEGEIPCTEAVRDLFAYVPQDYALLSGTVLDNLKLVAPELEQQRLCDALSTSQADFIWELTDKEKTQVRENNAGLSKGQLQRLAIARAVLMDRPIFLLDECTSALDADTEDSVLQSLYALGKRAIVVTHRPKALENLSGVTMVSMEQ